VTIILNAPRSHLMPRTCTICRHSEREPIERALVAGESYRHIAARFSASTSALVRHRADHLSQALVKSHEIADVARVDTLLEDVRAAEGRAERLYGAAEAILFRALESKDLRTALMAIREARGVMGEARLHMELRGDLTGELDPTPVEEPPKKIMILALPKAPRGKPVQMSSTLPATPERVVAAGVLSPSLEARLTTLGLAPKLSFAGPR